MGYFRARLEAGWLLGLTRFPIGLAIKSGRDSVRNGMAAWILQVLMKAHQAVFLRIRVPY